LGGTAEITFLLSYPISSFFECDSIYDHLVAEPAISSMPAIDLDGMEAAGELVANWPTALSGVSTWKPQAFLRYCYECGFTTL